MLPPFAEEMNKSRRLLAETARTLTLQGCEVLVPDLSGTGDSAGSFGEVTWPDWCEEVATLARQFHGAAGAGAPALLAIRSGALFLHVSGLVANARVVAWQPVFDGERLLQQFMRLRVMAAKFAGRDESIAWMKSELTAGRSVEIAGYPLGPALSEGFAAARLDPATLAAAARTTLLEVRTGGDATPTPPFSRFAAAATSCGAVVETRVVSAEQFWTSQEIAAPGAVTAATCTALLED
ncbi:MAG: hydrolase 2, exosortase A system-associated [Gammaproteobacteria bacterium]